MRWYGRFSIILIYLSTCNSFINWVFFYKLKLIYFWINLQSCQKINEALSKGKVQVGPTLYLGYQGKTIGYPQTRYSGPHIWVIWVILPQLKSLWWIHMRKDKEAFKVSKIFRSSEKHPIATFKCLLCSRSCHTAYGAYLSGSFCAPTFSQEVLDMRDITVSQNHTLMRQSSTEKKEAQRRELVTAHIKKWRQTSSWRRCLSQSYWPILL